MWCLETINDINQKLAEGKSLNDAYAACGILKADRQPKQQPEGSEENSPCGMQKPPLKVA